AGGEDVRIFRPAMDGFDVEQQPCSVARFRRARGPALICLAVQVVGGRTDSGPRRRRGFLLRRHAAFFPRAACDKMTVVCLAFIHRTGKGAGEDSTSVVSSNAVSCIEGLII